MKEFIDKLLENLKSVYSKLSLYQKLIAGGVILVAVIVLISLLFVNSGTSGVPLFSQKIDFTDFGRITKKLDTDGIKYSIKDNSLILVKDEQVKNKVIMMLAQDGSMPKGKYSFLDIINSKKLTSSKFENNIKLRAALEGKLEELLKSSPDVDEAKVSFTMPEQTVFEKDKAPVKVAVVLTPAWGVNFVENKKAIKGIEELIVNSIDRASKENVVITDNHGVKLNDFTDDEEVLSLRMTKENLKIRNEQVNKYKEDIYKALSNIIYDKERISILVDVMMNFDKQKENRTEILPVILKEDDPATPYDDGARVYSITESQKSTKETFKGPGFIPEGPPGFDSNVPPAYKGALEQMTEYVKDENIKNEVFGESKKEIVKDPWDITKITASVTVDGKWNIVYDKKNNPVLNPDGTRKREYSPVPDEDLRKIKDSIEQGIGFSLNRGDKVVVNNVPFDRSKQFEIEDSQWKRQKQTTLALFAGLIALIFLFIATIVYRLIMKEIERRKRIREEELARQHQLAREMALKSAEEEASEIEMSLEDKTRLEMQENAMNLAREHPEDVAQLIRTWLAEE